MGYVKLKRHYYRCPFISNKRSAKRMTQKVRPLVFYHQHHGMRLINLFQVIIILLDLDAR